MPIPEELSVHNYLPGDKLVLRFRQDWRAAIFQGLFLLAWLSGLSGALAYLVPTDSSVTAVAVLWPVIVVGGLWWSFARRLVTFDLKERLVAIRQPGAWVKTKVAVDELKLVMIEDRTQWAAALRYGYFELARSKGHPERERAASVLKPFATSLNHRLGMYELKEQPSAPQSGFLASIRALLLLRLPRTLYGALWQLAYFAYLAIAIRGAMTLPKLRSVEFEIEHIEAIVLAPWSMIPVAMTIFVGVVLWELATTMNDFPEKRMEWRGPAW